MQKFAPVALFVYNRPEHTRRTLAALQKNTLAPETRLFVYSDAAKDSNQEDNVKQVRSILRGIEGFRSVEIIERKANFGLANSIIDGVSRLVKEYDEVIVFEDDLVSSVYTLQYFNDALEHYREESKVMHIGAYMYPLQAKDLPQTFFYRAATSWGWATWNRAWKHFEKDIDSLMSRFSAKQIRDFSIDGTMNFWKQMQEFKAGKNNSWAIRWYASIFLNQGLTLNPSRSLINNIGHDGTGIHSGSNDLYRVSISQKPVIDFPDEIQENAAAYAAIKQFLKKRKGSLLQRLIRFIRK